MNRSWKLMLAGVLTLTIGASQALACGGSCNYYSNYSGGAGYVPRAVPQQVQVDPGQSAGGPSAGDLAGGDAIVNDLPAEAKRLIRQTAAKARVQPRSRTAPRTSNSRIHN